MASFDVLPDEILELILSFLSPYQDFKNTMLVCKLWRNIIKNVARTSRVRFCESIKSGEIAWHTVQRESNVAMAERYSHSSCYHNKSVYVFGGCTLSNTTFNDLWRFDLGTKKWTRPVALGSYPSPKACCSLVTYKDHLVLFGGWSHPTPFPMHQTPHFFDELHAYHPKTNRWTHIIPKPGADNVTLAPPGVAGHMASVIGQQMLVFGGLYRHGNGSSDDLWLLDLETHIWSSPDVTATKPRPRYGHSQVVLDAQHIVTIGGCGGSNMQFNDIWLLDMSCTPWSWIELTVNNPQHSPPYLWCHSGVKIQDTVCVFSRSYNKSPIPVYSSAKTSQYSLHNGQPSAGAVRSVDTSESSGYDESSSDTDNDQQRVGYTPRTHSVPAIRPNANKNRQRQLEAFKRYEERIKMLANKKAANAESQATDPSTSGVVIKYKNVMYAHRLDLSQAISEHIVSWIALSDKYEGCAPEGTMFYSLVEGRGEVIIFGGIVADPKCMQKSLSGNPQGVSNHVYVATFPRHLR